MVAIPGWAYLVVGGAMAAYAKFISARKPSTALTIFFWIGLFLLAIGVFKIAMAFIAGKKDPDEERRPTGSRDPADRPAWANDYIVCPRCNAKLNPRSRYCNWCGTRQ